LLSPYSSFNVVNIYGTLVFIKRNYS